MASSNFAAQEDAKMSKALEGSSPLSDVGTCSTFAWSEASSDSQIEFEAPPSPCLGEASTCSTSSLTLWQDDAKMSKALEGSSPLSDVAWSEVGKHSVPGDAWIVIGRNVYDITSFAPVHPGGLVIMKFAGVDASDQFAAFHKPRVYRRLEQFWIGKVQDDEEHQANKATEEYRALRKQLWKDGWFRPRRSFFVCKAFVALLLLALAVAVQCGSWKTRSLIAGAVLGLAWQQIGFLTHDADHWGIFSPRAGSSFNFLSWFLGGVLFGISRCMWNEEHSLHHAITLRPQEDPQFNYLPLWLITMKELDVSGTRVGALTRALVSVQHFTFLPVCIVFGRLNLYIISAIYMVKKLLTGKSRKSCCEGLLDICCMALHWAWYVVLVCQLDTAVERVLFVLVSNCVAGFLHVQLTVSHLATESFTAEEERAEQFFTFQLKTTRNIDSAWYDSWLHGGLEYQIEHHLFPQLPRHNLSKAKPLVQAICQRHGICYKSSSMTGALAEVLSDFRRLASDLALLKLD